LSLAASADTPRARIALGPWLWSPRIDVAVFAGSAGFALLLVLGRHVLGVGDDLPEWGWLVFVLCVDVAHVYSTLFRTYFDRDELRRHPVRYTGVPLLAYAAGVGVHWYSAALFWSVLAYLALFHFVRQQVGWGAVYRARAGQRGPVDKIIDDGALYCATLYPVLVWHAHLDEVAFVWFVPGDFVAVSEAARSFVPVARVVWLVALSVFVLRQVVLFVGAATIHAGKCIVVVSTAAIWYVGIVATNSDFDFTVTNVIAHGVPYLALLWSYGAAGRRLAPSTVGSRVISGGIGAFVGLLVLLALIEEMAWDRFVWHDRAWLFGHGEPSVVSGLLPFVVPLLAAPQVTHYLLDALLWRRRDAAVNPTQRLALGFEAR
jgi:hypothetical protein